MKRIAAVLPATRRTRRGDAHAPCVALGHPAASMWLIRSPWRERSAEGEGERLHARVDELDLERAIGDRVRLSDQLIQALLRRYAIPLSVDVEPMGGARRLAVEQHTESHRTGTTRRSHHEVQVSAVKAVGDSPVLARCNRLPADRPLAIQRPLVE